VCCLRCVLTGVDNVGEGGADKDQKHLRSAPYITYTIIVLVCNLISCALCIDT
jgi:hypothetical protein